MESGGAHPKEFAFRLFLRAASGGWPAAQYRLGRAYLLGEGTPCSMPDAFEWLERAAELGEPEAEHLLASLALQGIRRADFERSFTLSPTKTERGPDWPLARHWVERAAGAGLPEAQALLAYILTSGPTELRDPARGSQLYRQAAETGCPQGQLGWALALLSAATPDGAAEARVLLERAAAAGLSPASFVLGALLESAVPESESGGPANLAAATRHYRAAAEAGHSSAQWRYGLALLNGRGVPRDAFAGESWLRRAAMGGEPQAAAMIGDLYVVERDMPPNYAEAMIWFRHAAEAGHAGAARALGQMHLRGAGVSPDPREAATWLALALARGDPTAAAELRLAELRRDQELALAHA